MKIIIFVRHGESETNLKTLLSSDIEPYALTETGIKQATAVAEEVVKIRGVGTLYASPIHRALQTAEIVERRCAMSSIVDFRLRERLMGKFNNRAFSSREEMLSIIRQEIETGYKNGYETWDSLQKRMSDFAYSVKENIAVAVTHADPILSILGAFDPKYTDLDFQTKIPYASITALDFEKKKILCIGSDTVPESLKV